MLALTALILGYVMSMFYRSFLAIVAGDLGRDLGFGASELAGLSSAWLIAFALAQLPVGQALDRFGAGRTTALSSLAAVAGAVLFSLSHSYVVSLAAMAIIGVGCAASLMGATVYVARAFPPHRFAFLLGLIISVGSAGQLLGATPLALAVRAMGWRAAMIGTAGLTLLTAIAILATVRDGAPRPGAAKDRSLTSVFAIARLPPLWPMLPLIFVSYAVVVSERGLWIGPYLAEVQGLDAIAIGNVAFAMSVAMIVGAFAFGPIERLMRGPKRPALVASIATGAAFVALGALPPLGARITALLCIIGFFGLTYGSLMAHARLFIPDRLIGVGVTFINLVFMGGSGIVQLASGVFIDHAEASGMSPASRYGLLHIGFGLAVLAATVIYAWAPARPMKQPAAMR